MIIVQEKVQVGKNLFQVSAFADTKEEVTPTAEFVGLPYGASVASGSSVVTAGGKVAFMLSDGTWNWVGEES